MNNRIPLAGTFGLCLLLMLSLGATGEDLPTRGTFEGVYHRDRWGVGHISFFIVDPGLHNQLAKYDRRRIRLTVTKGEQPMNPGPAIIQAVTDIALVPDPPLQIGLRTIPDTLGPSTQFQMICELKNRTKSPLWVHNTSVLLRLRHPYKTDKPDEPSLLVRGYTRGQLAVGANQVQMYQRLVKTSTGGYSNLAGNNRVLVPPGDVFPLVVLFDQGLPSGEYEVGASARGRSKEWGDELPQSTEWMAFDVRKTEARKTSATAQLNIAEKSITNLPDSYHLSVRLFSKKNEDRRIARCGEEKNARCVGRLLALASDGSEIPLKVEQAGQEEDPCRLVGVPEEGVNIQISFRQETRFPSKGIRRLLLDVLTDKGIESFVVADSLEDVHVPPLPPFGKPEDGVNLRARPAKPVFAGDEQLAFHLQAMNVSGKPICWWIPCDWIGENVVVKIDGQRVTLPKSKAEFIGGWAATWTCKQPEERTIKLPEDIRLKRGEHTFEYTIRSKGGTYKNANNKSVPIVRGKIVSNKVGFKIQ